ncbi:hypothetical protein HLB44_10785 [Aquincola sp. S2]|uniref:Uncharacterized protein n=1 Tax=Pseudaquabacterium terrae TaxID=2732868 RepID=A0ABX2EFV6_9BURK|nr:hypothetical protein [Aquabacterium terrae]NRF67471.1 hypothetical protein [Aquabacterium terrae]
MRFLPPQSSINSMASPPEHGGCLRQAATIHWPRPIAINRIHQAKEM